MIKINSAKLGAKHLFQRSCVLFYAGRSCRRESNIFSSSLISLNFHKLQFLSAKEEYARVTIKSRLSL